MNTKQLRQKILDLAIRGKLVPQDPNDEPASVLLARVKAEKERLIAEGKIKRSKKKAVTSDKPHYPFEIPSNWIWVTLGEISFSCLGKMLDKEKNKGNCKPYLRNINVRWGSFDTSDLLLMPFEDNEIDRYTIKKGDLVVCEGGEPGRCAIWKNNDTIMFQKALHRIRFFNGVVTEYIAKAFELFSLNSTIEQYFTGSTIKHLTGASLDTILLPLPPEKEQIRIIQYINGLEAIVAEIENNCCKMSRFTSQVKSKILELAINGKLVPQDHADEPAEVLLKRVNPNAVVSADTSHYALPSNWVWVKGKDLFLPMKSTTPKGDTFKYIDIDSIDNKNQCISAIKVLPTEKAPSRASRYTEKNNVLFSMVRPYLRNIALVTEDECIASTGFYVCRQRECLDHNYLYYLMTSRYVVDGLNMFMKGDNSPSINKGHIDEFDFPLPPLNEQKRIVAKVAELFAQIDTIQQSLE